MALKENKWPFWYSGYRFWRAPIKATQYWFGNLRDFFHRGRLGWGYGDVWDIDMYLGKLLPMMFHYLAEHSHSCPMEYVDKCHNDNDTAHQAWKDDLNHMADLIEFANSDEDDHNKYAKEYWDIVLNKPINDPMPQEKEWLRDAYYQENAIIYEKQKAAIKEAFEWISEHYFNLWD